MRAAAQRALERVRVRVGEPGQRQPAQPVGVLRRGGARRHRREAVAGQLDQHARLGRLAAEPGELAPEQGHSPSRSTISRARASNAPCALLPRRERRGVAHAVEEQHPVEVVDLVLERPGGQPAAQLVVLDALAVEVADPHRLVARHRPAQVGHRQAALVDLDRRLADRLEHGVDDHRQRHRRLVRVARVAGLDLDDRHPQRLADLVGGEAGAVRGALRLDHVVDQALHRVRAQLLRRHLARALAQHRVADGHDRQDRHSCIGIRTPRSSATSTARS